MNSFGGGVNSFSKRVTVEKKQTLWALHFSLLPYSVGFVHHRELQNWQNWKSRPQEGGELQLYQQVWEGYLGDHGDSGGGAEVVGIRVLYNIFCEDLVLHTSD